jgi:hypothetical protein
MAKEDRPRKSWREIDRSRDGSSGSSARGGPPPQRAREEEHAQKQYRAVLEAAFAKGELGKLAEKLTSPRGAPPAPAAEPAAEAEGAGTGAGTPAGETAAAPAPVKGRKTDDKLTLRKRLVEAIGRQEITRAADRYFERFPLPDDHEFLEQILEHEQEARVVEAMGRIAALLDQRVVPKRSRALCGKLRYLAETSTSDRTQKDAEALLKRLS